MGVESTCSCSEFCIPYIFTKTSDIIKLAISPNYGLHSYPSPMLLYDILYFILLVLDLEFFIIVLWVLNLVSSILKFCNIYVVISTLVVVDWRIMRD